MNTSTSSRAHVLAGFATAGCFLIGALSAASCAGDDFQRSDDPDGGGTSGSAGASGAGGGGAGGGTGKDPNGTACADAATCGSGHCADGVCCDTACEGECESCNASVTKGTCTPYAQGADPESECAEGSCADGTQTGYACDGAGACAPTETPCGNYACGATGCNTTCSSASDCATTAWCDAGQCESKKPNGSACTAPEGCESTFCEGGFCCGSVCASPQKCDTGTCKCNGVECTGGATCITWHADADGDGHGVNGSTDTLGCSNTPPTISNNPGVTNTTDCDDANKDAFPGQTDYFDAPRANGTYDYNCDAIDSVLYPGVFGKTCKLCGSKIGDLCQTCLGGTTPLNPGYCLSTCTGAVPSSGYKSVPTPACGVASTLYTCGATSCASASETSQPNVKQPCH